MSVIATINGIPHSDVEAVSFRKGKTDVALYRCQIYTDITAEKYGPSEWAAEPWLVGPNGASNLCNQTNGMLIDCPGSSEAIKFLPAKAYITLEKTNGDRLAFDTTAVYWVEKKGYIEIEFLGDWRYYFPKGIKAVDCDIPEIRELLQKHLIGGN